MRRIAFRSLNVLIGVAKILQVASFLGWGWVRSVVRIWSSRSLFPITALANMPSGSDACSKGFQYKRPAERQFDIESQPASPKSKKWEASGMLPINIKDQNSTVESLRPEHSVVNPIAFRPLPSSSQVSSALCSNVHGAPGIYTPGFSLPFCFRPQRRGATGYEPQSGGSTRWQPRVQSVVLRVLLRRWVGWCWGGSLR